MATVQQMIDSAEQRKLSYERAISDSKAAMKQLGDLQDTGETRAEYRSLMAEQRIAVDSLRGIETELRNLRAAKAEDDQADRLGRITRDSGAPRPRQTATFSVGRNERTYHKGNDPDGTSFLRDVVMGSVYRDPASADRLGQHMAEERVERAGYTERAAGDLLTGGLGGIVVPQFLVEMTAPAIANLRPLADACNHHVLPEQGMSITIPRITTATSAAIQATQVTAVSATSLAETDMVLSVKTAAGQQNVSRQAIERGTGVGDVVMQDLFRQYATALDNELVNGATTGMKAVGTVNTYTSASPTAPEHYLRILGAMSAVEKALLAMGKPDTVVMHGRRWYWLQGQMVSVWPMINGRVGGAAGSENGNVYGNPSRGQLPNGATVVVDDNIVTNLGVGTNQDQIYVTSAQECHLWELPGQPAFIRAEQPNAPSLGVLLVVYGYFAYTFGRYPNSVQTIDGTGLVQPAGF